MNLSSMNWTTMLLWGFVATLILTSLLTAAQGAGLTRIDFPYMLGTMVTADRDRARCIGFIFHLLNGWVFAMIYTLALISCGAHRWYTLMAFGMAIGLVHSLIILILGMSIMPSVHPRMASERRGPDPTRQLEPPGFLALNYGRQTPLATIFAHIVFGAIIGLFKS